MKPTKRTTKRSAKSSSAWRVTRNPYLNFLRDFRRKHGSDLTIQQIIKHGARIWKVMDERERTPYVEMARRAPRHGQRPRRQRRQRRQERQRRQRRQRRPGRQPGRSYSGGRKMRKAMDSERFGPDMDFSEEYDDDDDDGLGDEKRPDEKSDGSEHSGSEH